MTMSSDPVVLLILVVAISSRVWICRTSLLLGPASMDIAYDNSYITCPSTFGLTVHLHIARIASTAAAMTEMMRPGIDSGP
jgi:hypothetical protein